MQSNQTKSDLVLDFDCVIYCTLRRNAAASNAEATEAEAAQAEAESTESTQPVHGNFDEEGSTE